jgi:endonuclease G
MKLTIKLTGMLFISAFLIGCTEETEEDISIPPIEGVTGGFGEEDARAPYKIEGWGCEQHFTWGEPESFVKAHTVLCHEDYLIVYDKERKIPRLTLHQITVNEAMGSPERLSSYSFSSDPLGFQFTQAQADDYYASGYDRGHMVPWADNHIISNALETNYYTNVAPMQAHFNRVKWLALENAIRYYVRNTGQELYVITGAVMGEAFIGAEVEVPIAFYKILTTAQGDKTTAYLMYQDVEETGLLADYVVSIDELEKLTDFNFFPALSQSKVNDIESKVTWELE